MREQHISVILPVLDEEVGIDETLSSLLRQSYDNFEILVVDNGSIDGSFAVANEIAKHADNLRVMQEKSVPSSYAARNKGISAARGDTLIFLDANMTVTADFLQRVNDLMLRTNADYLGYRIEIYCHGQVENLFEQYDRLTAFPVEEFMRFKHFTPTAALAVRKRVFEEIGLFDHNLVSGGDYEFGNRVYKAGFKHHYSDEISVYHPARRTLWSHVKKAVRLGRGKAQLLGHQTRLRDTPMGLRSDIPKWSPLLHLHNFTGKIPSWDTLPLTRKVALLMLRTLLFISEKVGFQLEKLSLAENFR